MKQSLLLCTQAALIVLLFTTVSCQKNNNDDDPELITGTFEDMRDGNIYNTIQIGKQIWMAENLRYLPAVSGPTAGSNSNPHYYVYGYSGSSVDEAIAHENYNTYGVLYNWPAAMAGLPGSSSNPSRVQGICPAGWHLPSDAEWNQLSQFLGGNTISGGKLKEKGLIHWTSPNEGATNSSGFTALPGGVRTKNGVFGFIGFHGYWWTTYTSQNAWYINLMYHSKNLTSLGEAREFGFSVRCVMN